MAENTLISWATHTFNHVMGCTKVSPACAHCYAERDMDHRYGKVAWGPSGTRVITSDEYWRKPLSWNRDAELTVGDGPIFGNVPRPRVFCASLADVFEDWKGPILNSKSEQLFWSHSRQPHESEWHWIPERECAGNETPVTMNDVRASLFALIDATPNLDWLLLTKRTENIRRFWPSADLFDSHSEHKAYWPNVWLGTSVENQEYADKRIPELLKCRDLSSVLWLSCEPLLGALDLRSALWLEDQYFQYREGDNDRGIDWVVTGGESGPDARPSHPDWFRSLRDQCGAAGVPFHFKQWGEWVCKYEASYTGQPFGNRFGQLSIDGKWYGKTSDPSSNRFYGDEATMVRIGVKQSGRLLDGVLYDAFPIVDATA